MIQSIHRSTSFAFPLASKIGHRPARAEFVVFVQKFTMHMEANPGCVCNDFRSGPSMPRRMSDERDQIIECNPPLHTCDERDSSYFRVRIVLLPSSTSKQFRTYACLSFSIKRKNLLPYRFIPFAIVWEDNSSRGAFSFRNFEQWFVFPAHCGVGRCFVVQEREIA